MLLEKAADINEGDCIGQTPFLEAAAHAHDKLVQVLRQKGADRDGHGRTPLHEAAAHGHGHDTFVQVLLERRADINARDDFRRPPLHPAASMLIAGCFFCGNFRLFLAGYRSMV